MILIILLVLVLLIECIYYIYFVNQNETNTIDYFRDIPSNENPAIIGLMVKGNVDGNDIISTILDLWEKGYITVEYRIIDGEQKCILKETDKDRFFSLKDYENYLLDEIFKNGKEAVFEDFVNSSKFEIVFKNIGNMIRRRVDIKSTHKISYKKLKNKINFLVNYIVLGFSLFFPIIYLVCNNFILSLAISYLISFALFFILKSILVKEEKGIESLLFGTSIAVSIVYIGLLIIAYIISGYVYSANNYLIIIDIFASLLLIVCFIIGDYNKKLILTQIDYIMIIYSIISSVFGNITGISIAIIYFSHRLYLKSPKHVYLSNSDEIEKWIALKNFLNDFSLISERKLMEVKIWNKYLIYGISMGVNKKIILEYAKIVNMKLINQSILDKCYTENIMY